MISHMVGITVGIFDAYVPVLLIPLDSWNFVFRSNMEDEAHIFLANVLRTSKMNGLGPWCEGFGLIS